MCYEALFTSDPELDLCHFGEEDLMAHEGCIKLKTAAVNLCFISVASLGLDAALEVGSALPGPAPDLTWQSLWL